MTREKAYDIIKTMPVFAKEEVSDVIYAIYDAFKSRTCANCKHSDTTAYKEEYLKCWLGDIGNHLEYRWGGDTELLCTRDFGCNKFEAKEAL